MADRWFEPDPSKAPRGMMFAGASLFMPMAIMTHLYDPVLSVVSAAAAGVGAGTIAWGACGHWKLGRRLPIWPPGDDEESGACLRISIAAGIASAFAMFVIRIAIFWAQA